MAKSGFLGTSLFLVGLGLDLFRGVAGQLLLGVAGAAFGVEDAAGQDVTGHDTGAEVWISGGT
jgi:hypothetical protein